MRTRWMLCGPIVLLLCGCTLLAPVDVAGTWVGELVWGPDDPMAGFSSSLSLTLQQSNVEISGTIGLAGPGATIILVPITTGRARISGMEINCTETVQVAGSPQFIELSLDGDRSGDELRGTGQQTVAGETHQFEWSVRLSAPPPEPSEHAVP